VKILVVDDEPSIRFSLAELLDEAGHEVREAPHAPAALALLDEAPADLVISDLTMPAMDGLQLLDEVRSRHPGSLVVLMTAHGDERTAVRALKDGAYDYVPKPFDNEEIRALVRRAREVLALRAENARLRQELAGELHGLIGESAAIRDVARVVRRAAPTDATVLLTGESGTGKEVVARALHAESRRRGGPFVALNCSALPGELVESELFGHLKGAFTGADREREGLFEAADGGTLFLDEIGDLPLTLQGKILKALEEKQVRRVGAVRGREVDVRIIAATHVDLAQAVRKGEFREDLFYRLSVIPIHLPPLRERGDDVVLVAEHFLRTLAEQYAMDAPALTPEVRRALLTHSWPGNVRELRNGIERALLLGDAALDPADLFPSGGAQGDGQGAGGGAIPFPATLAEIERSAAFAMMERMEGNKSAAAEALGISRSRLYRLLEGTDEDVPE